MSSVTLTCMVEPSSLTVTSYQWDTTRCYTNSDFTGSNPDCFPHGQVTQNVTANNNNLVAHDAGTITCTVTISGSDYTSGPFTLRVSGEQLVYCVITCIVYCKQCMLLLLATCYCCIIHQLLWFMYRGIFTVGVTLTRDSLTTTAVALTDYSYVYASGNSGGVLLARCVTGLGPSGDDNGILGGWYFDGNMIPNGGQCSSGIQVIPGGNAAGVINIRQCQVFSTSEEGIYTCTMMNSSMMNESVRLGVYLTGRSESLDIYIYIPSLNHLSSLYTAAPMIDTPSSSNVTVTIGSSLTLSCTSRGSPPDTFTWRKADDPTVLLSTTTPVTYNDNSAVFHANYSINSVTISDSGTYTCNVTNPIGSDSTTITVDVGKSLI